jgi:hypothetical protein
LEYEKVGVIGERLEGAGCLGEYGSGEIINEDLCNIVRYDEE